MGSKAPVFTLPACRQRMVGPESFGSAAGRSRPWASTGTRVRRLRPRPKQADGLEQGGVGLLADDHRDRGSPEQALGLHVPAGLPQHRAPGRGQRGEVGHGRPGHEGAGAGRRQTQQLQDPAQADGLQQGGARGHVVKGAVLVPGARQPVGRQRGRQRSADDEAEEPRSGHGHGRRCYRRVQQLQHLCGLGGGLGQGGVQRGQPGDRPGFRGHAAGGQLLQIADRPLGRRGEQAAGGTGRFEGLHPGNVLPRGPARQRGSTGPGGPAAHLIPGPESPMIGAKENQCRSAARHRSWPGRV